MRKIVVSFLGLLLVAATAWATATPFKESAPQKYTVKEGDTLWDISSMYLQDPWRWTDVWTSNPQIDNPNLIYPGDVIGLVYVDGEARLVLERNGYANATAVTTGRTVKLSPQIHVSDHEEAIAAIPLDIVNAFLARTRIVDEGELEAAPYVLAGHERRLMSGDGDDFYVRGVLQEGVDFYGIYRKADPYIDEENEEVLGYKAEDIGSGQLKVSEGDISTFVTTRSEREIRVGDRLLPHEERRLETTFFPQAPENDIFGEIIGVEGGVSQVGTLNVVALNKGEREGLVIGNVLAIYKKGEKIKDRISRERVTLPSERAGLLMVFRTFEKMSFALVLSADRPLAVMDEVRSP